MGSVRTVLTDELRIDYYYPATLEGNNNVNDNTKALYYENQLYTINTANIKDKSAATNISDYHNKNGGVNAIDFPPNYNPKYDPADLSQKLYNLKATSNSGVTGLGITIKVMAGDKIDIYGKSYYFNNTTGGTSSKDIPIEEILTGLLMTPTGATAGKGATSTVLSGVNGVPPPASFYNHPINYGDVIPNAYINWILLDDQLKYKAGGAARVGDPNVVKDYFSDPLLHGISVSKNGYLYVYCSNQSPVDVFFDNIQVVHTRGALLEENAYYPGGLKMTGICSVAGTVLENNYTYQGVFSEQSKETGWNEFTLRNYDAQVNRWTTNDPYDEFASGYVGMGNDPVNFTDPSGGYVLEDFTGSIAWDRFFITGASSIIGAGIAGVTNNWNTRAMLNGAAVGGGVGLGLTYVPWGVVGNALGDAGKWVGNLFQNDNWWVLYEGQQVIFYQGNYGNTSNEQARYRGTSGLITYNDPQGKSIADDYRNSKYQFTKQKLNEGGKEVTINVGPIPEGKYSIDLSLDPNRRWKLDKSGNPIPDHGIEQIGNNYPEWGTQRARLDIEPGTNTQGRDFFYFHNSTKGYSHGCVETQDGVFSKLLQYRSKGKTLIKVKISYGSQNKSTYGRTDKK